MNTRTLAPGWSIPVAPGKRAVTVLAAYAVEPGVVVWMFSQPIVSLERGANLPQLQLLLPGGEAASPRSVELSAEASNSLQALYPPTTPTPTGLMFQILSPPTGLTFEYNAPCALPQRGVLTPKTESRAA